MAVKNFWYSARRRAERASKKQSGIPSLFELEGISEADTEKARATVKVIANRLRIPTLASATRGKSSNLDESCVKRKRSAATDTDTSNQSEKLQATDARVRSLTLPQNNGSDIQSSFITHPEAGVRYAARATWSQQTPVGDVCSASSAWAMPCGPGQSPMSTTTIQNMPVQGMLTDCPWLQYDSSSAHGSRTVGAASTPIRTSQHSQSSDTMVSQSEFSPLASIVAQSSTTTAWGQAWRWGRNHVSIAAPDAAIPTATLSAPGVSYQSHHVKRSALQGTNQHSAASTQCTVALTETLSTVANTSDSHEQEAGQSAANQHAVAELQPPVSQCGWNPGLHVEIPPIPNVHTPGGENELREVHCALGLPLAEPTQQPPILHREHHHTISERSGPELQAARLGARAGAVDAAHRVFQRLGISAAEQGAILSQLKAQIESYDTVSECSGAQRDSNQMPPPSSMQRPFEPQVAMPQQIALAMGDGQPSSWTSAYSTHPNQAVDTQQPSWSFSDISSGTRRLTQQCGGVFNMFEAAADQQQSDSRTFETGEDAMATQQYHGPAMPLSPFGHEAQHLQLRDDRSHNSRTPRSQLRRLASSTELLQRTPVEALQRLLSPPIMGDSRTGSKQSGVPRQLSRLSMRSFELHSFDFLQSDSMPDLDRLTALSIGVRMTPVGAGDEPPSMETNYPTHFQGQSVLQSPLSQMHPLHTRNYSQNSMVQQTDQDRIRSSGGATGTVTSVTAPLMPMPQTVKEHQSIQGRRERQAFMPLQFRT